MINFLPLLKNTRAYKTIKSDKENNRLSHAYLVICSDKVFLPAYMKVLAKLFFCESQEPCGTCRTCKLIDGNAFPDVSVYPEKEGDALKAEDVVSIIEQSYFKPIESDKKLFLILNGETMNLTSQNKLLKTLEEPPKGVHIIIGATSEYPILPTVKSRMKRLDIEEFKGSDIFDTLCNDYKDKEKLTTAIACGDGTIGRAIELYGDEKFMRISDFIEKMLTGMQSSRDILEYSTMYNSLKIDVKEFLDVLKVYLRDMLIYVEKREDLVINPNALIKVKSAKGYNEGATLYALKKIEEAEKRYKYNANPQMLIEWLMFAILEGKHKWQQ